MERLEKNKIKSRIKTGAIAIPLLIFLLSNKLTLLLLLIAVCYFSYKEFYVIQNNTLATIFDDYYTKMLRQTLLSSPIFSFIFMLCPILFFLFPDAELIAFVIPVICMCLFRLHNFLLVFRILITPEFEVNNNGNSTSEIKSSVTVENSSTKNLLNQDGSDDPLTKKSLSEMYNTNNPKTFNKNFSHISTDKKKTSTQYSQNLSIIKLKMYSCCLFIILLDLIYFLLYIYPISFTMYFHNLNNGAGGCFYLVIWILLCWQCDTGALIFGSTFGKTPIGRPITPSKTQEGVYGAIIIGFLLHEFTSYKLLSFWSFTTFCFCLITVAVFGDFFESFLKRCSDIKDSGELFPGHGGLLDRIDSITLAAPIMYYFLLYQ